MKNMHAKQTLNIFNGQNDIQNNRKRIKLLIKEARNIIIKNKLPVDLRLSENLQKIEKED